MTRILPVLAVVLAVLVTSSTRGAGAAGPNRYIPALDAGDAVPPIPLIAQDDRHFTFADFAGQAVVVSFIYTRCRDVRMCPLVGAKFARMQHAIGSAPIRFVTLSLDPGYDTPAVLRRYGRALGQDPRYWSLATGSLAAIDELAKRLGIASSASAPGVIIHTEAAVVIGPNGRIAQMIFGNTWTPADLLAAARSALPGGNDRFAGLRAWLETARERCGGSGLVLGVNALAGIFAAVLAIVGSLFWLAFRDQPAAHRSAKAPVANGVDRSVSEG